MPYRAEGGEVFWYRREFDVSDNNVYASFVPLEILKYVFAVVLLLTVLKQLFFFSLERERRGMFLPLCLTAESRHLNPNETREKELMRLFCHFQSVYSRVSVFDGLVRGVEG